MIKTEDDNSKIEERATTNKGVEGIELQMVKMLTQKGEDGRTYAYRTNEFLVKAQEDLDGVSPIEHARNLAEGSRNDSLGVYAETDDEFTDPETIYGDMTEQDINQMVVAAIEAFLEIIHAIKFFDLSSEFKLQRLKTICRDNYDVFHFVSRPNTVDVSFYGLDIYKLNQFVEIGRQALVEKGVNDTEPLYVKGIKKYLKKKADGETDALRQQIKKQ